MMPFAFQTIRMRPLPGEGNKYLKGLLSMLDCKVLGGG
ncbi:hypothetical protein SAMN05444359_112144 [Neolewinella agarilytica]|uniref:Uncharacterized protein n=1 Tax=Neolewinella agarilytica TaxID=478744 RepID=A0A1H9HFX1_9BACT|nr:hypothetical protein SAMN05444359_112144 [Neolewinella agarilytica]